MIVPKGFLIGAATAAHQVEGNNIHSDYWVQEHLPHTSFAEPSGMACDHYHRYREDVKLLKDLGRYAIMRSRKRKEAIAYDDRT